MADINKAEISIVLIQVGNFNRLMDEPGTVFYDVYRTYLRTQEAVLDFVEVVYGTYVSIGNGRFMIFCRRSDIEPHITAAHRLLIDISDLTKLGAIMGIGYGGTAREAERFARRALNYAEEAAGAAEDNHIFIIDAAGKVTKALQDDIDFTFEYRTENAKLIEKLNECGIGISTYHRLLSVQSTSGANALNSVTVAEALGMTPRNARNILASLTSVGLAMVVGKESSGPKGRPMKIYRITENV